MLEQLIIPNGSSDEFAQRIYDQFESGYNVSGGNPIGLIVTGVRKAERPL